MVIGTVLITKVSSIKILDVKDMKLGGKVI